MNKNSISNKFDQIKIIFEGNYDYQQKLNLTFPLSHLLIDGNGVGVIIYGREDTFSKKLKMHELIADIEVIYVELNLRKTK